MKLLHKIWIVAIGLPLVLSECSKPKEISCSGTMSFKKDIIPIITTHCAISGCHTGPTPEANLNMDSANAYHNLISKGYVIAGKSNYSIMYNQMLGTGGVPIMPPTGQLDHSLTDKVYCWINEGALDN
ncbi:MAG: hypothetical protein JWO03_519 [Bacteroidetes bacterium]|nr:hypothetical protein [Bacteroidota bacterium]